MPILSYILHDAYHFRQAELVKSTKSSHVLRMAIPAPRVIDGEDSAAFNSVSNKPRTLIVRPSHGSRWLDVCRHRRRRRDPHQSTPWRRHVVLLARNPENPQAKPGTVEGAARRYQESQERPLQDRRANPRPGRPAAQPPFQKEMRLLPLSCRGATLIRSWPAPHLIVGHGRR
jgi:hypothetical protein